MIVQVALLNRNDVVLWYTVPPLFIQNIVIGTFVIVPLKNKQELGIIVLVSLQSISEFSFTCKDISRVLSLPNDPFFKKFIQQIAHIYLLDPLDCFRRLGSFLLAKRTDEDRLYVNIKNTIHNNVENIRLTDEQEAIVTYVNTQMQQAMYAPTLLHGVTGSGKTEVYKALMQEAYKQGKSTIFLLPEVSLTLQFYEIFKQQLSHIPLHGFHSLSSKIQKKALWDDLLQATPMIIIGVHMPIFLPVQNLGLIIIDEEHETGFIEKKNPRFNSKHLAICRANLYKIPILLGSATPSVTSLYNVTRHNWKLFVIQKRFAGIFPQIQVIVLQKNKGQQKRTFFWISLELELAIRERLVRKEQVIIFLNRRGYAFFVQCKSCGFIFTCPSCSVSLTLHVAKIKCGGNEKAYQEQQQLWCHYCNHKIVLPSNCSECKVSTADFLKKGIGTQQILDAIQKLFPKVRIARADLDSVSEKKAWQKTLELFASGEIDILVGTQTITKGYHFPRVTLVGVIWADASLHFPFYNAVEVAVQQLIQVAGRSGRSFLSGNVIVQTIHNHHALNYIDEMSYREFCKKELLIREEGMYPPFTRLAYIEICHSSVVQVEKDALYIADCVNHCNTTLCNDRISILGPALPIIYRIKKIEKRHLLLKAKNFVDLHVVLERLKTVECKSTIAIFFEY